MNESWVAWRIKMRCCSTKMWPLIARTGSCSISRCHITHTNKSWVVMSYFTHTNKSKMKSCSVRMWPLICRHRFAHDVISRVRMSHEAWSVILHTRMRHESCYISNDDKSFHTYERVLSRVALRNESPQASTTCDDLVDDYRRKFALFFFIFLMSCHTYEWGKSDDVSSHTYQWVMSHITHTNEARVTSHTRMSHASCHT